MYIVIVSPYLREQGVTLTALEDEFLDFANVNSEVGEPAPYAY